MRRFLPLWPRMLILVAVAIIASSALARTRAAAHALLASLFSTLPDATPGAVIIDAMLGLITRRPAAPLQRQSHGVVLLHGAGLAILFFGITRGILIGVVRSLPLLIARASGTSIRQRNREPDTELYLDASRHEGLEPFPSLVVARIDGPLFSADADRFRARVREIVGDPSPASVIQHAVRAPAADRRPVTASR